MKRTIVAIITGLFILSLAVSSVSAVSWLTYREDVNLASGTVDFDVIFYNNATTTEIYRNVTLPCNVGNLTTAVFNITGTGTNGTYNLSVNGNSCNASSNFNNGSSNLTSLSQMVAAGVSNASEYLNFTFDANVSDNEIAITLTANDANFTSAWLLANIAVKERDVNTPTVSNDNSPSSSFWTVNDSVNVSSTIGYTLTDLNFTITWPSHKVTAIADYHTIATMANGSYDLGYYQYQKMGPYIYDVDEDVDGTTHTVTVLVKNNELLTLCVDWSLSTIADDYDNYFNTLNYDSLDVELNGNDIDWEEGSIEMEDFTLREPYSLNKFTFEWNVAAAAPGAGTGVTPSSFEEFDWTQNVGGFPLWMLMLFVVVIAAAMVMIIYYEYYSKK